MFSTEHQGCQTVISLEHLHVHRTKCIYNPETEIICDKGCNLKITRREYNASDCITHLSNRGNRQHEEITKLRDEVRQQRDDLMRLTGELSSIRLKMTVSENTISRQQDEITRLHYNACILPNRPSKCCWQVCESMKFSSDKPTILEFGDNSWHAFAQLFYPLKPRKHYFRVQILDGIEHNSITIGLTQKGHPPYLPPGTVQASVGYCSTGHINVDGTLEMRGEKWKKGDFIECGIEFPSNSSDEDASIEVIFSLNIQLISRKVMKMPQEGLYPTVYMWRSRDGTVTKVEYFCE